MIQPISTDCLSKPMLVIWSRSPTSWSLLKGKITMGNPRWFSVRSYKGSFSVGCRLMKILRLGQMTSLPMALLLSSALDRLGPMLLLGSQQQPQIGPQLNQYGGPNNGAQEQVAQLMDADIGWAPWPNNEFQVPVPNLNILPPHWCLT